MARRVFWGSDVDNASPGASRAAGGGSKKHLAVPLSSIKKSGRPQFSLRHSRVIDSTLFGQCIECQVSRRSLSLSFGPSGVGLLSPAVWRSSAYSEDASATVAVKTIHRKAASEHRPRGVPLYKDLFHDAVYEDVEMEMEVMRQLRRRPHPNLLSSERLGDRISDDAYSYIVLRYARHGDLYRQIETHGAIDEHTARRYFRGIVSGLEHLRALGYSHRDVSLENIFMMEEEDGHDAAFSAEASAAAASVAAGDRGDGCPRLQPVLGDFGLAIPLGPSDHPSAGKRVGKSTYMAPEVFESGENGDCEHHGYKNDGSADLWSLGIVLFMCLTGVPPFVRPRKSDDNRFAEIAAGGVGRLLRLWGYHDISPSAVDLLTCLLRVDPAERPSLDEVLKHAWLAQDAINTVDGQPSTRGIGGAESIPSPAPSPPPPTATTALHGADEAKKHLASPEVAIDEKKSDSKQMVNSPDSVMDLASLTPMAPLVLDNDLSPKPPLRCGRQQPQNHTSHSQQLPASFLPPSPPVSRSPSV